MTLTDLEVMVQNLNHRVTSIEQFLPRLATRDDLAALATRNELNNGLEALERRLREELASKSDLESLRKELRQELAERFGEARRYALVLHEDLKSDIGLIAEHLADVMSRLPQRNR